jgi:hypothetical protein
MDLPVDKLLTTSNAGAGWLGDIQRRSSRDSRIGWLLSSRLNHFAHLRFLPC